MVTKTRMKLIVSAKAALVPVAIGVPARLLTVESATLRDEWYLYLSFYGLLLVGFYFTITFAQWLEQRNNAN